MIPYLAEFEKTSRCVPINLSRTVPSGTSSIESIQFGPVVACAAAGAGLESIVDANSAEDQSASRGIRSRVRDGAAT